MTNVCCLFLLFSSSMLALLLRMLLPRPSIWSAAVAIPAFRKAGPFCLPVPFVASLHLHALFKCCPLSLSTSAFLGACLAMFCISATFTATAFPRHLSFSVQILHFIPHLPAPSPMCLCSQPLFPYAFLIALCPFWHICGFYTKFEQLPLLCLAYLKYLKQPPSNRLVLLSPKTFQYEILDL
jgi:hypothetical protein